MTLEQHIPQRTRRPDGSKNRVVSLPLEEYTRLQEIANALNVSLPTAIITLMNYADDNT